VSATPTGLHRARERVQRVLYSSTGVGGIVFGALLATKAIDQSSELNHVYALVAIAVGMVLPASFVFLAWVLPLHILNGVAAFAVISFVALQLLWLPAMTVDHLADLKAPWLWGINAVQAVMTTILVRHRIAFVYAGLQGVIVAGVGWVTTGNEARLSMLDGVGALVFCAILIAASLALVQAADQQDLSAARARAQASIEAAKRTREREQTRINAIVHDDIMSVLLVANRDGPSQRLAEQAESALASIATLSVDPEDAPDYERSEAIAALRTAVTDTASSVEFWHSSAGHAPIPAEVIESMTEAISEAVRNSVLHAGGADEFIQRIVTVNVTDDGIRATIQDNGCGFNLRSVNDRRLGIRVSIFERMRLLTGGNAEIDTRPRRGTTVTLTWMRRR
jgi:signal transduction histidine kinase